MESLVAFGEDDAPRSLVVSVSVSATINLILFLANSLFLVMVLVALAKADRAKHREVLILLVGQLFFTALTCGWASSVLGVKKSVEACNYLASAGAFVYCMSFAFSYLLLLNRAKSVNEWEQTKCFNALHSTVTLAVYGMGAFSIVSCFLLHGKTFFKEHYCAQVCVHTGVIWVMLFMDTGLSLTLFYLFAGPMIARLRMTRGKPNELEDVNVDEDRSVLKKAAWRNFVLSGIQISSTFVVLVIVVVCNEILNYSVDSNIQVLNMITVFSGPIDTSINAACSLAMVQKVWRRKHLTQVAPRSRPSAKFYGTKSSLVGQPSRGSRTASKA